MHKPVTYSHWVMGLLFGLLAVFQPAYAQPTDLTTHQPTTVPTGVTFEWHTGSSSTSSLVSTPGAVSAGLYYGFYNYGSSCYSQGSPLRVVATTCPTNTVDLSTGSRCRVCRRARFCPITRGCPCRMATSYRGWL